MVATFNDRRVLVALGAGFRRHMALAKDGSEHTLIDQRRFFATDLARPSVPTAALLLIAAAADPRPAALPPGAIALWDANVDRRRRSLTPTLERAS